MTDLKNTIIAKVSQLEQIKQAMTWDMGEVTFNLMLDASLAQHTEIMNLMENKSIDTKFYLKVMDMIADIRNYRYRRTA